MGGVNKQTTKYQTSGACHLKQKGIQNMNIKSFNHSTRSGLLAGPLGLASALLVVFVTLNARATTQVTVNPSWSTAAIQTAIDTYDVVKFAPGVYVLECSLTDYHYNSFVITKSVKLIAADAHNKPCLYSPAYDPTGVADVRPFVVNAPLDATVVVQDLKIFGSWNIHIVTCGAFTINGCEPAPPDPARGLPGDGLGVWVNTFVTDTGKTLPCQIGQFTAVGNRFGGNDYYAFYVEIGKFGNDALHASFVLQKNSFVGMLPASIMQYGSLKMMDNDFTCTDYYQGGLASGFLVGCDDPESSAMLDHNRVFLEVPQPQEFDLGLDQLFVQVLTPFSLGSLIDGVGAHNVDIKNTTICSAPEGFALPYVCEAWDAHNCSIKGTSYAGVQVAPPGSQYDFFSEWVGAYFLYGNNAPFGIGLQNTAEYMIFYSSDVSLIDNQNPQARVLEYPVPGNVRLLGTLQGMQK
jgi:hypothetical protein